jgi:hypothetical protein
MNHRVPTQGVRHSTSYVSHAAHAEGIRCGESCPVGASESAVDSGAGRRALGRQVAFLRSSRRAIIGEGTQRFSLN